MPPGEFVIGRSSACNLALDDALVSRRHAKIDVGAEGAFVEDLGSRNGISVNGERVEGKRRLAHLDRVTIGSHELVVVELPDRGGPTARCEICGEPVPLDAGVCRACGAPLAKGSPTLVGMTLEIPVAALAGVRSPVGSDEPTARSLLSGIADKALALGRYDEAERVLGRTLQDMLLKAAQGKVPAPAALGEAAGYGLRLAEGTRKSAWLDWLFDLHSATGRMMTADEIERLHELVRKLRYTGALNVRRYVDVVRARAGELGPRDRFLLSRLESLQRMVSA